LRKYGYTEVADELRRRTLDSVNKWYLKTGTVFEFYDADDIVEPFHLKRKGEQPKIPDYRVHVHAISDYHWTACFVELLINEIYN
jgi:neutral trehalase